MGVSILYKVFLSLNLKCMDTFAVIQGGSEGFSLVIYGIWL